MNFGAWLPLDDATMAAPDASGVLQARADAIIAYPRGRTAMVLYACTRVDETLRRYVTGKAEGARALARASAAGARFVRFGASPTPVAALDRLMVRFVDRFGARPVANTNDVEPDEKGRSHDG